MSHPGEKPISAGPLCAGFLVKEDMIITAAHFVNEKNVINLRIVLGFKMVDATSPVIEVPDNNIYQGHPVGLPLKYAPGAHIMDIPGAYFSTGAQCTRVTGFSGYCR